MGTPGFVYVLINSSLGDLVKFGTARDPEQKARELSAQTETGTPFVVAYSRPVRDCDRAEAYVQAFLEAKGYRISRDREFVRAPIPEVINATLAYPNESPIDEFPESIDLPFERESAENLTAEEIHLRALEYLYGYGDSFQDPAEAIALLLKAAERGNGESFLELGRIYLDGVGGVSPDPSLAIRYLRKGAELGNGESFLELGRIYMDGVDGIPPDLKLAIRYLRQGAEQAGYAECYLTLAAAFLK